jgi:hypothetical protein
MAAPALNDENIDEEIFDEFAISSFRDRVLCSEVLERSSLMLEATTFKLIFSRCRRSRNNHLSRLKRSDE